MTATDQPCTRADPSLTAPFSQATVADGPASADWFHSDVPRRAMKAGTQRRNVPAIAQSYGEMFMALRRQRTNPSHSIRMARPATAWPFCDELHQLDAESAMGRMAG